MKLAWTIARRYLFAKKSHHLINIISWVSVTGVAVGTFGLVVVLSVFNGFGDLVMSLYNSFDPDLRVTPVEGKFFPLSDSLEQNLRNSPSIAALTLTLEDNALLRYMDRQYVVTVKGVSEDFLRTSALAGKILEGEAVLQRGPTDFMMAGAQIAYSLGLRPNDPLHQVSMYMPRKGLDPSQALLDPDAAFSQERITAAGIFGVQQEFDGKYVIVPLRFMRRLSGEEQRISALEIKLKDPEASTAVAATLSQQLGKDFVVKDRLQQHAFLYRIIRSEKVAVYAILGFILLIAAFNLFGTLTMLILDKRADLHTLYTLGADLRLARRIFLLEGLLISVGGAFTGMLLGALVCGIQQTFGLLKMGGDGFLTEAYPVAMRAGDFVLVALVVLLIGFAAAAYTAGIIVKRQSDVRLRTDD